MSSVVSRVESGLPDIDDRLVEPETRHEMLDGRLVRVAPADAPHAERHAQLVALIAAHIGPGFRVAADLLTRTSRRDDIAPDISVYPAAPDPRTGRRQLAQLAFEIAGTESLGHAGQKAAKLTARGVRRVFVIHVGQSRALEWSAQRHDWDELDDTGYIEDPALQVPLPIKTIIATAETDGPVQHALIIKRNPVLEAHVAAQRALATAEATAKALLTFLAARGITVEDDDRARILGEHDQVQLDRWLVEAVTCTDVAALFTTPSQK